MNEFHRNILIRNRVRLVSDLSVDMLVQYMIQDGIMSPTDSELIDSKPAKIKKNEYFIDTLATKGEKAFDSFMNALKELEDPLYLHLQACVQKGAQITRQPYRENPVLNLIPGTISPTTRPHQVSQDNMDTARIENAMQGKGPTQASQDSTDAPSPIGNSMQGPRPIQVSDNLDAGGDVPIRMKTSKVPIINMFPERRVTEIDLNTFAGKMGAEWQSFILTLGLNSAEIFHASANANTIREKIFGCLVKWRNRESMNATVRVLVQKCMEYGIDVEVYEFLAE